MLIQKNIPAPFIRAAVLKASCSNLSLSTNGRMDGRKLKMLASSGSSSYVAVYRRNNNKSCNRSLNRFSCFVESGRSNVVALGGRGMKKKWKSQDELNSYSNISCSANSHGRAKSAPKRRKSFRADVMPKFTNKVRS